MKKYASYLVCGEYIHEVKGFLSHFFEEKEGKYNFEDWVTFITPDTSFVISLMGKTADQPLTQNMTFEISCESLKELETYAETYNTNIDSFVASTAPQHYRYYYIEIPGPQGICKLEINYCEDLDTV